MDAFELELVFTAAGAMVAGGVVATFVELLKRLVFPDHWSHGRAPIVTAAALAAALVVLAVVDTGLPAELIGTAIVGYVLAWMNVTAAAIGGFEVTRKGYEIATRDDDPPLVDG